VSLNIAYFDCFSGISGDMMLGALLDLGWKESELRKEAEKLKVSGWELEVKKVSKQGIAGTQVKIRDEKNEPRAFERLIEIIEKSDLENRVKEKSRSVLTRIGEAESRIHGIPLSEVHLHELGGVDTVIDVVGTVIGIERLGIERIYASKVHVGKGFTNSGHGILPLPAPATLELLKDVPIYGGDVEGELTTPTGAAIISSLASGFGRMPSMVLKKVGYGAGERDFAFPNLLRVSLGTAEEVPGDAYVENAATVIEVNIDDMNPEIYPHLMEKLLEAGAKDVYFIPIHMKKNRPGILLGAIVEEEFQRVLDVIFRETTTIGVRTHQVWRKKLSREETWVSTKYGKAKVKLGRVQGKVVNISPEYESCRELSQKSGVPLKDIYQEIQVAVLRAKESTNQYGGTGT
jgi:uncharacterized protein (TIGR00299 family) protein